MKFIPQNQGLAEVTRGTSVFRELLVRVILSQNKNPKLRPRTVNVTAPLRGESAAGVWCPERRRDLHSRFFSTLAERRSSLLTDRLRSRAEGLGLGLDHRGTLNLNIGATDDAKSPRIRGGISQRCIKTPWVLSLRTAYSRTSRSPSHQ